MSTQRKARAGLLLFLTAGPFLVFLFLYIFGKNHFELDRYPASSADFLKSSNSKPGNLLLMDTVNRSCSPAAMKSQLSRLGTFWEDLGASPEIVLLDPEKSELIKPESRSWFLSPKTETIELAKGKSEKILPEPPRAFLFDRDKNLRGVYGLCNNKSVDTLMLEYRILNSN